MTTSQFQPWLQHVQHHHRSWFNVVFSRIISAGYELHDTGPMAIMDGRCVSFKKGDCHIDVSRQIEFSEYGCRAGVQFMAEMLDRQISITVNTPLEIVAAILTHIDDEN